MISDQWHFPLLLQFNSRLCHVKSVVVVVVMVLLSSLGCTLMEVVIMMMMMMLMARNIVVMECTWELETVLPCQLHVKNSN